MATRKPGQLFEDKLTDEELVRVPPKMLSPTQRRRRRYLKNEARKKKVRRARAARVERGEAKVIMCQGYNLQGNPCGAYALTGAKHCRAHLNEAEKAKLGIVDAKDRVKPEGPVTQAPKLMRLVVETAVDKIVARYFKALGIELLGFDEEGNPIIVDHGAEKGIRIHGESKDGYIEMSNYPDLGAQIQVMEKLLDRTYGKAKQTQVLEGGDKPVRIQPVKSEDRAKKVISVLQRAHVIPHEHEGRTRRLPSEPAKLEAGDKEHDNVVPLNDT